MSDYAPQTRANPLPKMTTDEVKARAQLFLNHYGQPPYSAAKLFLDHAEINPDHPAKAAQEHAAALISEFVYFWLPFIHQDEQK